jgi:hypothetical protein
VQFPGRYGPDERHLAAWIANWEVDVGARSNQFSNPGSVTSCEGGQEFSLEGEIRHNIYPIRLPCAKSS